VRGHYTVREALEVQAAILFSQAATAAERAELQRLAARVDALSVQADGNRFVYLRLHERLHRKIAEYSRCPALCEAIDRTTALSSTWLCATRTPSPNHPPRRHQDLLSALTGDDPAAAGEAMREHIQLSMQNTLQRLEPCFKLGKKYNATFARTSKGQVPFEALIAADLPEEPAAS
jgi:DNA-binding GntR family transcriptional regulator